MANKTNDIQRMQTPDRKKNKKNAIVKYNLADPRGHPLRYRCKGGREADMSASFRHRNPEWPGRVVELATHCVYPAI